MLPILEKIEPDQGASYRINRFHLTSFPLIWHEHPEVELTLIESGRGRRHVGDSVESFEAGDLVLLGSRVPHSWATARKHKRWCVSVVAQFREDAFGPGFFAVAEMREVRGLLDRAARGLVFEQDTRGVVKKFATLPTTDPTARLLGLLDVLHTLSSLEARPLTSDAQHQNLRDTDRRRVEAVCVWLSRHYLEPVSLDEVAEVVGLAPSTLCRLFRRVTGRTVTAYLHEQRVDHACQRLADTERQVTEIAFESGFGNLAHFNRVFRRLRGVTPRAYRKATRAGAA